MSPPDGYAKFTGVDDTPLRPDSPSLAGRFVQSDDVRTIVELTQAEYDVLDPVVATTLYVIVG